MSSCLRPPQAAAYALTVRQPHWSTVIDRNARDVAGLALRRLAAGRIFTADYEETWASVKTSDEGVRAALDAGWGLYSDYRNYRLRNGDELSPQNLAAVGRCVLFLKTDLEYEWPPRRPSLLYLLLALVTLGIAHRRSRERWERSGDYHVWPFLQYADYKRALGKPPFLIGSVEGAA